MAQSLQCVEPGSVITGWDCSAVGGKGRAVDREGGGL